MANLIDLLVEGVIATIISKSPKAKKAVKGLKKYDTEQKKKAMKLYDSYKNEAENMSTSQLAEKYKSLSSEGNTLQKSAYAEILKKKSN